MIAIKKTVEIDVVDIVRRSALAETGNGRAMLESIIRRSTEVRIGFVDGVAACVWGVIPPTLLSNAAYLWLLTTEIAAEHKFLLVRHSQRYIEEALKSYPQIIGDVMADNRAAKRWLQWLGADFLEPIDGRIPFVIRRK